MPPRPTESAACDWVNEPAGANVALVANGARAVFFGHDHVNDLTLYNRTDDIYLTYIRLTTVKEEIPDAEGYNILTVGAHGGYDYRAYKPDGTLDAELFVG